MLPVVGMGTSASDGWSAPGDQRDHKEREEDHKTYFGNRGGEPRESAESENQGDDGDDEEGDGPGEHGIESFRWAWVELIATNVVATNNFTFAGDMPLRVNFI